MVVILLADVVLNLLDQLGEVWIDCIDGHPLEQPDGTADGGAVERVVVDGAIHP